VPSLELKRAAILLLHHNQPLQVSLQYQNSNVSEVEDDLDDLLKMINSCKKGDVVALSGTYDNGQVGLWVCKLEENPKVTAGSEFLSVRWYEGNKRQGFVVTYYLSTNRDTVVAEAALGFPDIKKPTPTDVSNFHHLVFPPSHCKTKLADDLSQYCFV
jgi:hypothetical protein